MLIYIVVNIETQEFKIPQKSNTFLLTAIGSKGLGLALNIS